MYKQDRIFVPPNPQDKIFLPMLLETGKLSSIEYGLKYRNILIIR